MDNILNDLGVVCPSCKGFLTPVSNNLRCDPCDHVFSDLGDGCFDMMPPGFGGGHRTKWELRLEEMEGWYQDLLAKPTQAASALANDYQPLAGLLGELRGSVLDVGGGPALTREFLADGVMYISIDPSMNWTVESWASIADRFPILRHRFQFVRGVGEYLPFPASSFDAVVSLWALNHALEPRKVFDETYRVLKRGGRFIAVLEDMAPQWPDIARKAATRGAAQLGLAQGSRSDSFRGSVKEILFHKVLGKQWPLQHDHIRITEAEIDQWVEGHFRVRKRDWRGGFLTYDLIRT